MMRKALYFIRKRHVMYKTTPQLTVIGAVLCAGALLLIPTTTHAQDCFPPQAGLVGWWPGDGNAMDIHGSNDGVLQGGTGFLPGKVGEAFSLDGVDDFVLIPQSVTLDTRTAITIVAWINPAAGTKPIVEYNNGYWFGPQIWIHIDDDPFANFADPDEGNHILKGGASNAMSLNQWHHVAATYDDTTKVGTLYLDGNIVDSRYLGSFVMATERDVYIGFRANQGQHTYFDGLIDEVQIFNRALSPEEIQAIYDCNAPAMLVSIDVKPGSDPNCFNVNGQGVIPVAILGSAEFDVNQIDVYSLTFDGMAVRVRGKRGPLCSEEDSNGDGYMDFVCHFEDDAEYWAGGDDEGTVTGVLFDGTEFEGTDSICVVP